MMQRKVRFRKRSRFLVDAFDRPIGGRPSIVFLCLRRPNHTSRVLRRSAASRLKVNGNSSYAMIADDFLVASDDGRWKSVTLTEAYIGSSDLASRLRRFVRTSCCLLYTSDAADERSSVD